MQNKVQQFFGWMNPDTGSPAVSVGLLVLRLGVGGLMLFAHGWGKLAGYGERAGSFPDPLGVGSEFSLLLVVFAEVFCALFIMLGLATRAAVVPLIINMLVITFVIHADDPFRQQEFALLFAIPFLTLLFTGAGRFSLDALFTGRSKDAINVAPKTLQGS